VHLWCCQNNTSLRCIEITCHMSQECMLNHHKFLLSCAPSHTCLAQCETLFKGLVRSSRVAVAYAQYHVYYHSQPTSCHSSGALCRASEVFPKCSPSVPPGEQLASWLALVSRNILDEDLIGHLSSWSLCSKANPQ